MKEKMIQDIYAYCDRWCEKCAFGSRCQGFVSNKNSTKEERVEKDEQNRQFWDRVQQLSLEANDFIEKNAKVKGVDLLAFEGIPHQVKFDLFQRKAVSNKVLKAGRQYEDRVDDWLDKLTEQNRLVIVETAMGGAYQVKTSLKNGFSADWVNQMLGVLLRYQLQLYLKISRGYYSKGKAEENTESSREAMVDSLGVVKETIELIDRSMAAWYVCMQAIPTQDDAEIEGILILLMRIKNNLMIAFPEAKGFVRPGFDE